MNDSQTDTHQNLKHCKITTYKQNTHIADYRQVGINELPAKLLADFIIQNPKISINYWQ